MTDLRGEPSGGRSIASPLGAVGKVGLIRPVPRLRGSLRTPPRDRAIPHLPEALDAATMRWIFQSTLFADRPARQPSGGPGRWQVRRCEIEWIKYRPGKNCTVAYRVGVHDPSTNRDSEQLLCARVFEEGRSRARFQAIPVETLVPPQVGHAILHLPEMDMIVCTFPNDIKLHALPSLVDAARLRSELLPAVVAAAAGPGWTITAVMSDVVQYVPEETCTVRVRAHLESAPAGERRSIIVYGKIAKEGHGADTFTMMQRLWDCGARRDGRLRMAQPLVYDFDRHALWQRGVPGAALLEEDLTGRRSLLASAADAVGALHTSGVACSRSVDVADARSRLAEMKRILPRIAPSCRGTLEPLVDRLLARGEHLGDQPVAVLHGDLRLRHLIVDGDDVSLIDVDTVCRGSPWQDIGSLAAAMLYKGMLARLPRHVIEDSLCAFCAHYARSVPWSMRKDVVSWYTAVALINERAFRCVTRLQQDKLEKVEDLVELASHVLGRDGTPWC
jgi:hypothetical protein